MAFRTNKMPVLQEKSSSGSVATFNTALAMPLVNGEFSIQAYQEGTGVPSPVNVRNIVPFNALNMYKTGRNLCPYKDVEGVRRERLNISLLPNTYTLSAVCTSQDTDFNQCAFLFEYTDGSYSSLKQINRNVRSSADITLNKQTRYLYLYASANDPYSANDNFKFSDIQIEFGSTATSYEPYVTPEVNTKQLGEDIYGGSYNSVSGVKRKTFGKIVFDGSDDEQWANYVNGFYIYITDMKIGNVGSNSRANWLQCGVSSTRTGINFGATNNIAYFFHITDNSDLFPTVTDKDTWKAYLSEHPLELTYELAEPIESNIGATPILTNIGDNNIFCDTGDTSLTYKDLDIAKRGNFREVFKLPS